jgi:hypothetical protein
VFDQADLFNPKRGKFHYYLGGTAGNTQGWIPLIIPRNAAWVYMIAIGSGAGGAGGQSSGNGVLGGGGGGSGSGALARLLVPAPLIPDQLYVHPGIGGTGGGPGGAGGGGARSIISMAPFTAAPTIQDLVLASGTAAAGGAVAPAGASSASGAGETVSVAANQTFASLGLWVVNAGQGGTAGGASAGAGVNVSWGAGGLTISGGAGGGTTDTTVGQGAGGQISGTDPIMPNIKGGTAGGGNGNTGVDFQKTMPDALSSGVLYRLGLVSSGGAGGGAKAGGVAGNGGSAGIGSGGGGGGGGGGTGGGTGGSGGNGGQGLIIIAWW